MTPLYEISPPIAGNLNVIDLIIIFIYDEQNKLL